jgi:hypothetical protein
MLTSHICWFFLSFMAAADCAKEKSDGNLLGTPLISGYLRAETGFEWSGVFETPADIYLWSAQKVDGQYADTRMKLVALPVPNASPQALKDISERAQVVCYAGVCGFPKPFETMYESETYG